MSSNKRRVSGGTVRATGIILDFRASNTAPQSRVATENAGFSAQDVVLESVEGFDYRVSGDRHYLALHDIVLRDGEVRMGGGPPSPERDLRQTLTYAPAGTEIAGWSVPAERRNGFTAILFDPRRLHADLEDRYGAGETTPFLYRRDDRLYGTLSKLRDALRSQVIDNLYIESLCLSAAVELTGLDANAPIHRLSPAQVQRALDFIESHMGQSFSVAELAEVARLSRFHFTRAFKATLGKSPYRFVIVRRLERARHLLLTTRQPISGIAASVGFASTAQFGRAFRSAFGVSPRALRRDSIQP